MLIYHLVIEFYLDLMCLHSSIILLIINMDDLQVQMTIYALLVSCPLYSFVVLRLDEQRNMEIFFFFVAQFIRALIFSSHHI